MSSPRHQKQLITDGIHTPIAWKFATLTDRLNFTPLEGSPLTSVELTIDDLYRLGLQLDDDSVWMLTAVSPLTWVQLNPTSTFSGSIIGGGDAAAAYLVLSTTSSLSNERLFSISGSVGLKAVDNSANGTFVLSLDNSVVAMLSSSVFTGLTGSLQQTAQGLPYLLSQGSITITTMSNGQVVISGSGGSGGSGGTTINVSGGDPAPSYLVLGLTSSLSNERVFSVSGSSGLKATDSGANGALSLSIDNSVVATLSGSTFTGPVIASGGLTGSLQKTQAGLSYLVGVGGISITSQSNGQILISGSVVGSSSNPPVAGTGILVVGTCAVAGQHLFGELDNIDAVVATPSHFSFSDTR